MCVDSDACINTKTEGLVTSCDDKTAASQNYCDNMPVMAECCCATCLEDIVDPTATEDGKKLFFVGKALLSDRIFFVWINMLIIADRSDIFVKYSTVLS